MKKLLIILAVTALAGPAFAQRISGANANGNANGSGTTANGSLVVTNRSPIVQGNFNGQVNLGGALNAQANSSQQANTGAIGVSGPASTTITR